MIKKLKYNERQIGGEDMVLRTEQIPAQPWEMQEKINELVDAVNELQESQNTYWTDIAEIKKELQTPAENVQDDHYWFKQQERYNAALVLIRDLTGGGMSYHDIVIEMREIAKWALDPNHQPLLIGRYNKEASELLDVLRETKGGDNEK